MEKGEGSNQIRDHNNSIDATPLSILAPNITNDQNDDSHVADGLEKRGRGRPKGSQNSTKKLKKNETKIPPTSDQETGNSDLVNNLMMKFDAVRRRLSQIGQGEASVALEIFKKHDLHTNKKKRVGSVPGINIGDIFFLWGEMGQVGLHAATLGVEFIGAKDSEDGNPLAVCVVSCGKNADKSEDPRTLIYTGFGGTKTFCDQTLERMNLSLATAVKKKSVVRVVRTKKNERKTTANIYIYDGLYLITHMWEEKCNEGFKVFKFKLTREADQKPAFEIWKSVEKWKNNVITRPGLVLQDLSFGAENLKVSVVNEFDEEKGPALFTYVVSLKHSVINIPPMVDCCTCRGGSCSSSRGGNCGCVERNIAGEPYVEGLLVTRRPIIYECGGSCLCVSGCKNKMIQMGLKFNFEVFKTVDCGWGLRSWDAIRAGSFICEYAGDIIQKGDDKEDDFIFDTSRVYKTFRWNYEPELVGEDASERVLETQIFSSEMVISAKKSGNVARFMNHSCSPNVFWQSIAREQNGLWCIYIGFFAMKHIPPLMELRYDYGTSGGYGQKICLCRSEKCSGSFG